MLFDRALKQQRCQLYRRQRICIWKEQIWFKTLLSVSEDSHSPTRPLLPPASLISILRKFYFVLFSWILPRWLRLHSQAVELKTSLCSCLSRFWAPTLYDVNPKLAWHHRLVVCSDLALCAHAPNPRSTSETRAWAFCPSFEQEHVCCLRKDENVIPRMEAVLNPSFFSISY